MHRLDPVEARALAERLPEDPYHVVSKCHLFRRTAEVWGEGERTRTECYLLRLPWVRSEPVGIGHDPDAIWRLLSQLEGWNCVNVEASVAPPLASLLERSLGHTNHLLDDLYFVLHRPVSPAARTDTRLLDDEDAERFDGVPPELHPVGYDSVRAALTGGIVAGSFDGETLVAVAQMASSTEEYADVGVHVLAPWRGQGRGLAVSSLVCGAAQGRGLIPVWSTGGTNVPSQRTALRLGFSPYGRQAYVVVPSLQSSGGYRP